MEKQIEGVISYKITFEDGQYILEFNRTQENQLAAAAIAHDMVKFNKEFLTNLRKNLKGQDVKECARRITLASQCQAALKLVVTDIFQALLHEKPTEVPVQPDLPHDNGSKEPGSSEEGQGESQVEGAAV